MENYEYDAFLSFAVEDKIEIANELYHKLEERGLKIWYSGRELTLGTSIQDKIREGLDKSRYGILLISPNYFKTNWAQKELGALWAKEREGNKVIIPVFHNISPEEVGSVDPAIAERWSVSTADGVDVVCEKIMNHIQQSASSIKTSTRKRSMLRWLSLSVFIVLTIIGFIIWQAQTQQIPEDIINQIVSQRIDSFQTEAENDLSLAEIRQDFSLTNKESVIQMIDRFSAIDSHYRNYYEFTNGYINIQFEKNVSPATGIDFDKWTPADDYGFKYPRIHKISNNENSKNLDVKFLYFNTQPASYKIEEIQNLDSVAIVSVNYQEPIRLAMFHYQYGTETSHRKYSTYTIKGFLPKEHYYFTNTNGDWRLSQIK